MAARPPVADILRLAWATRRGSPIDPRMGFLESLRELKSDTAPGSPLTMEQLLEREDFRDLRSAKLHVGDPAFDFELQGMRLSGFREVQPVALIFGSYT